jgi:hypothetical protein
MGLPALALGKAVCIAADGFLAWTLLDWGRTLGRPRAGLLAAGLAAFNPVLIRWSVSGMESALVGLFTVLACRGYATGRRTLLPLLLAVLFLLRWDSVLLAVLLFLAQRSALKPAALLRQVLFYLLLIAPWLVVATAYFGSPLPITAGAKWTVYRWPGSTELFPHSPGLAHRLLTDPAYAVGGLVIGGGLVAAIRASLPALLAPAAWLALYIGALAGSPIPLFEWYLVPALAVGSLFGGIALDTLGSMVPEQVRGTRAFSWVLAIGAALGGPAAALHACTRTQDLELHLRKPLGEWLRRASSPGDRVLLEPIGYIGYYSGLRVLDVVGLVSPEVRPFWQAEQRAPLAAMVRSFQPEWCVLRPAELAQIEHSEPRTGTETWWANYAHVRAFTYQRAGDARPFVLHVYRRRR